MLERFLFIVKSSNVPLLLSPVSLNCCFKGLSSSLSWKIVATGRHVQYQTFLKQGRLLLLPGFFPISVNLPSWIKDCLHVLLKLKPLPLIAHLHLHLVLQPMEGLLCVHYELFVIHLLVLSSNISCRPCTAYCQSYCRIALWVIICRSVILSPKNVSAIVSQHLRMTTLSKCIHTIIMLLLPWAGIVGQTNKNNKWIFWRYFSIWMFIFNMLNMNIVSK